MENVDKADKLSTKLLTKSEIEKNDITLLCMKYGKHMYESGLNNNYSMKTFEDLHLAMFKDKYHMSISTSAKVNICDTIYVREDSPNIVNILHFVNGFFGCGCSNCPLTQCPEVEFITFTLTFEDDTYKTLKNIIIYDRYCVMAPIQGDLYKYILSYVISPMYIAHHGRQDEMTYHYSTEPTVCFMQNLLGINKDAQYCKKCQKLGDDCKICCCL